ncbi:MAG: DUF4124 domain-containing protein [Gammaproteobacteria bacterium]|nr:DUF4124 domain-containing protein [Gammaproteobacteria bacterium]
MIIDVQKSVNGRKNGFMPRFNPSRSLSFTIALVISSTPSFAAAETIFSWQAADGSTTFSDRPPHNAKGITFSQLYSPALRIPVLGAFRDPHLDKEQVSTSANANRQGMSLTCEHTPSKQPKKD